MVKHTQAIRQQQLANCLSVFDHIVKLGLKELTWQNKILRIFKYIQVLKSLEDEVKF